MKIIQKNKTVLIALVVFLVAIYIYNSFFSGSAITQGENAQTIGNDVVSLDNSLNNVSFDQTLFNTPIYRSLNNWTPTLSAQPTGRTNPFAPIGQ